MAQLVPGPPEQLVQGEAGGTEAGVRKWGAMTLVGFEEGRDMMG